MIDELQQIGLGKNEVRVYLALLETGKAKAGDIIKQTGLHRNLVYQSLESLEKRNLLTRISGKTALFQITDPVEILNLVKKQESIAQRVVDELKEKSRAMDHRMTLYEGSDGFRSAFWDIIETLGHGEELLVMGIFDIDEEFQSMIKMFHEERAAAGIPSRLLLNAHATHVGDMLSRFDETNVRYMQPGLVTPSVFFIYADKTMISLPNQRTFIRIENEEVTCAFRSYFNTLWDRTTQTLVGADGVKQFAEIVLATGKSIQVVGAHFRFAELYPEIFQPWHKRRAEAGVVMQATVPKDAQVDGLIAGIEALETRRVNIQTSPNVVWIFGDYVANVVWLGRDDTTIFLMKNHIVADQQREYFNHFWESGKKSL
ncbi:MAG: hypothetical protein O2877_00215 [bacterium]|nr:hypothetical protein [bacterium]